MKKQTNTYSGKRKSAGLPFLLAASLLMAPLHSPGQQIKHLPTSKTIEITDSRRDLAIQIDYAGGCKITGLHIKGENTLSPEGVYTGFKTAGGSFCSLKTDKDIRVTVGEEEIVLNDIQYGDLSVKVNEVWTFKIADDRILWTVERAYSDLAKLEEMALPQWNFKDLGVWKGGILDNGGMVWCKYLSEVNDTYGVHTGGVTFWEPESGNALRIVPRAGEGKYMAAKYSHSEKGEFACTHFITDMELEPRYNLSRFVRQKPDVFVPFNVSKGKVSVDYSIQYINYDKEYSRGNLPGIDEKAVRELLNTTGRYGVVDNGIVGANGWITNWKCLHEPFFAQTGLALGDRQYTQNLAQTLDRERDHAIREDGRVLSRWHDNDGDQMPGTFNYKTGYYEAVWGYTVDSQTGQVINTAELFNLNGDIDWLRSHKNSCEKALEWLIKRDSNRNGIFEMMNSYTGEGLASDWLDIVWASFENAFVNAQMYEALNLWAECELVMGDDEKAARYRNIAERLKDSFNKPIEEGGFWHAQKKQYVYWRDKDGSVHGDNLVTPVNFAVIGFGLCNDKERIKMILEEIEKRTVAEHLFHWPLCFDSYREEEVSNRQWPFPVYENGDIFPTWGYLGVRAYVKLDRKIALKYIGNLLEQYKKDGLSSQRYSRITQQGEGTDILAGICTGVTALYRDIYGIRPKWNRMGLEPNLTNELNGTAFTYILRDTTYHIKLSVNDYAMATGSFSIRSKSSFGAARDGNKIIYYPHNKEETSLVIAPESDKPTDIRILNWNKRVCSWKISTPGTFEATITGLCPGQEYNVSVDNKRERIKAGENGHLTIRHNCKSETTYAIRKINPD
ncbi:MAG: hypothetical protein LBF62_03295 [Tannerellaceae bacterium]|jgi:hypothetical protein|nr:hypothetical protein [Tannerellaceae bacterium]